MVSAIVKVTITMLQQYGDKWKTIQGKNHIEENLPFSYNKRSYYNLGQSGQIQHMADIFSKLALLVNYVAEYHPFGTRFCEIEFYMELDFTDIEFHE